LQNLLENPAPSAEAVDVVPAAARTVSTPPPVAGRLDPYTDAEHDKRGTMHIGSYLERINADIDWERLKNIYHELQGFVPVIEQVEVDGRNFYRMSIRSDSGGFKDLCNRMRSDNIGCILR
jgi:hypothetical protein